MKSLFFTVLVLTTATLAHVASAKGMSESERNAELNDLRPNSLFCHVFKGASDEAQLQMQNGRKVGVVEIKSEGLTITVQSVGSYLNGEIKDLNGTKLVALSGHGGEFLSSHLFANGQTVSVRCMVLTANVNQ